MAHYYTNDEVISEESTFTYTYKNKEIIFTSDHGVFSRNRVDYGSNVLLQTVNLENVDTMLDVGCGYGAIGISVGSSYTHISIDMVDINKRAIILANKNIKQNKLTNIQAFESNIYENVNKSYDLIVSNPPIRAGKKVVNEILEKAYEHLNIQGRLVIVIQKKQGAPSAKKLMEETFGNVEILKRDKGYYILQSMKKE